MAVSEQAREKFLSDAARRDPGNEVQITVRGLISKWNAQRRGYWYVLQINSDLRRHGLITEPPFTSGYIDNVVTLKPVREADSGDSAAQGDPSQESSNLGSDSQETESALMSGALTFADLDRALFGASRPPIVSVAPDAKLETAQSLMMRHDFSQLPVMSGERSCRGAVSWESIARTLTHRPDAALVDCVVPVDQVQLSDDVLSNVPKITANGFVFTRDHTARVVGVVTTADLSSAFQLLSGPFLLIGIAEQRLRSVASAAFTSESIRAAARHTVHGPPVEALTLGELKDLFDSDERWAELPDHWSIDRKVFRQLLGDVVELRNHVMHFRGEVADEARIAAVRNLISWLKYLAD